MLIQELLGGAETKGWEALRKEVKNQCLRRSGPNESCQPIIRKAAQESGTENRNRAKNGTSHGQWATVSLGVLRAASYGTETDE